MAQMPSVLRLGNLHCTVMYTELTTMKERGEGLSTDSHGSGEARRRAKESLRDESLANP